MTEQYCQSCCISSDHPSLAGHFPSNPIVPGVVILDEVVYAVQQAIGLALGSDIPLRISTVKFLAPLLPEQSFVIHFVLHRAKHRIDFQCRCDAHLIAKGVLQLDSL